MRHSHVLAVLILSIMALGLGRIGLAQDVSQLRAVTDASFDAVVLKAQKPVVVLVQASWCGPCRMVMPSVSSLQTDLKSQVLFATLDVDSNPNTPSKFDIRSIPAFLMFKKGKLVARQIGAAPQEKLSSWIHQTLEKEN